jgi:FMN phosphatase YigB (HAD superfamily)
MAEQTTWLIDFDDTLASGNLTWAVEYAFPKFVQENHLAYDKQQLGKIMLQLQERKHQNVPLSQLLYDLFTTMEWPHHLEHLLLDDLMTAYQPSLFEDVLPFLHRLKQRGRRIIVLSNNPHTLDNVSTLEIEHLVDKVYTPYNAPDTQPKPHPSLWTHILMDFGDMTPETTTIVGDDPWSDGSFADHFGLQCWLVDRSGRLTGKVNPNGWRWVRSLDEVEP